MAATRNGPARPEDPGPHGPVDPGPATHDPHPHGPRALVAVVILVPLLVGLALAAFAWPAARMGPRDLPVGVVASGAAGVAIERRLAGESDAVEVHRFGDLAAAREAIAGREVYGAIVVAPEGTTILTASAASPVVAQLLQQAAAPSGGAVGAGAARVVDVVPADPDDPRGAALAASVLPLVLAGMAAGLLVWRAGGPGLARWGALAFASAGAGLVAAGIAQGWLGVLGGDWLVNAGALGLTVLAVGATVAGLAALAGPAGAALGALLMVLVGNPLSGVASAPELLPQPAGAIGQLLPPGAGGSLLRSTAFFDGAGAAGPLAVLAAWVALGLVAAGLAALRRRRSGPVATPQADPVAVA
jgi:hypothetical protein